LSARCTTVLRVCACGASPEDLPGAGPDDDGADAAGGKVGIADNDAVVDEDELEPAAGPAFAGADMMLSVYESDGASLDHPGV